jgi:hypothetical protein
MSAAVVTARPKRPVDRQLGGDRCHLSYEEQVWVAEEAERRSAELIGKLVDVYSMEVHLPQGVDVLQPDEPILCRIVGYTTVLEDWVGEGLYPCYTLSVLDTSSVPPNTGTYTYGPCISPPRIPRDAVLQGEFRLVSEVRSPLAQRRSVPMNDVPLKKANPIGEADPFNRPVGEIQPSDREDFARIKAAGSAAIGEYNAEILEEIITHIEEMAGETSDQ